MSQIGAKDMSSVVGIAPSWRALKPFVMALCLALAFGAVSHACPTCKQGIAEGSQQAGMVRGYFWSILFMMSMPFVIFGSLGAYFYYQVRLARSGRHPNASATPALESKPIASS